MRYCVRSVSTGARPAKRAARSDAPRRRAPRPARPRRTPAARSSPTRTSRRQPREASRAPRAPDRGAPRRRACVNRRPRGHGAAADARRAETSALRRRACWAAGRGVLRAVAAADNGLLPPPRRATAPRFTGRPIAPRRLDRAASRHARARRRARARTRAAKRPLEQVVHWRRRLRRGQRTREAWRHRHRPAGPRFTWMSRAFATFTFEQGRAAQSPASRSRPAREAAHGDRRSCFAASAPRARRGLAGSATQASTARRWSSSSGAPRRRRRQRASSSSSAPARARPTTAPATAPA